MHGSRVTAMPLPSALLEDLSLDMSTATSRHFVTPAVLTTPLHPHTPVKGSTGISRYKFKLFLSRPFQGHSCPQLSISDQQHPDGCSGL